MEEAARLAALARYEIVDTPPEAVFDAIAMGMATTFGVHSALVSFIDRRRQWYKACVGVVDREVARVTSFCTHSIETDSVTVVGDARLHERFRHSPFVKVANGIRFYAAAPIKTPSRARIGTVCIFDPAPRIMFSERQQRQLSSFAAQVVEELEARLLTAMRERQGASLVAG